MQATTKMAVVLASAVADRALRAGGRLLGVKPVVEPRVPGDGDVCDNRGPTMGPALFRRFCLPSVRRLAEAIHGAGGWDVGVQPVQKTGTIPVHGRVVKSVAPRIVVFFFRVLLSTETDKKKFVERSDFGWGGPKRLQT